jgi:hypothetical protein
MFLEQTHQLSPDLGVLELWCNRCGDHVAHDLLVTTDNKVTGTVGGKYRDENRIKSIVAECADGHRQTIL